jgi:hypothetical protein
MTLHSAFKIPIPCYHDSNSSMDERSEEALQIKQATCVIIDEASMINKSVLGVVDRFLKLLMGSP